MGQKVFNYGRSYTDKKAKDELVHSTPGCGEKINTKMKTTKKEKDGETIRESSNQFTPFRRVVFDWQFKEKAENVCIGWGRAVRPRTTQ